MHVLPARAAARQSSRGAARSTRRALAGLLVAASVAGVLAGCSSSGSCVDYAAPAPLASRYADADFVAVVRYRDTGRTVQLTAVYPVHEAQVVRVLRGKRPSGRLLVTVVPGDCSTTGQAASYEHGDPLDRQRASVLLLDGAPVHGVYTVPPWSILPLPLERQPGSAGTASGLPLG